jgi:hypothetical protein
MESPGISPRHRTKSEQPAEHKSDHGKERIISYGTNPNRMKPPGLLDSLILTIRGQKVLLDADLAAIYGVPTKALNQAVKRNAERFPEDFILQLSDKEKQEVVTNCDHLARLKFSKNLPYAFTEHGALMAANVLNSPQAVKMSVHVVRAFIKQRELLAGQTEILKKLAQMDAKLLQHDDVLRVIWQELQPLLNPPPDPPRPQIGFHVQEALSRYRNKPPRKQGTSLHPSSPSLQPPRTQNSKS